MRSNIQKALAGAGLLLASAYSAAAFGVPAPAPLDTIASTLVVPIAQGCGPGAWRGPWGGCRNTPYVGPLPGGGWVPPAYSYGYYGNGCPPGYWHGPWGHCRNTPYHGRLPDGGWK